MHDAPAPPPLHFYFDFISPYGYFASLRIEELAQRHGRSVDWHAMLLGVTVLKVMGLKPLLDTPLKGDYVRRDVKRYQRLHQLRMARSVDGPVPQPLAAARAFHWVRRHQPSLAAAMAHALYGAIWGRGLDLPDAASVAAIGLPPGIDPGWLARGMDSEEARNLLRAEVDGSLKAGIFGSPTVVVDGEPFWGVDRLDDVDDWLTRGGW